MQRLITNRAGLVAFQRATYSSSRPVLNVFPGAFLSRDTVTERVIDVVQCFKLSRPGTVDINTKFVADLGMDSLLRRDLNHELAREFCVPPLAQEVADSFVSVKSVVDFFASHPKAR